MPAAALYWRVRTRDWRTSNAHALAIAELRLYDAAGTELVATSITSDVEQNAGSYPLSNMADGNVSTVCYIGGWTGKLSNVWDDIVYEFASPVLLDNIKIYINSGFTVGGYTRQIGYETSVGIDSSSDGVTWIPHAYHTAPMPAENAYYVLAAHVQSLLYPIPDRSAIAGTGGIYGIVSEDGVALPNRPVYLYEREGFTRCGAATTDENGGYAFNGINENKEFLVMSVDPTGAPYKNAIVWDRITPINTKGAQVPQSSFWARRFRGMKYMGGVGFTNYLDGTTYNYLSGSVGTPDQSQSYTSTGTVYVPDGYSFHATEAADGAVRFLKSNHTGSSGGRGAGGAKYFDPPNNYVAGDPANYAALSFEWIFIPPAGVEPNLIMIFEGNTDSSDRPVNGFDNNRAGSGIGPLLQVTPSACNFRMPLGGVNGSTIRATCSPTAGVVNHIVVTYVMDSEIKMYKNGTLVATTAIAGSGRPYGYQNAYEYGNDKRIDNWNYVVQYGEVTRFLTGWGVMGEGVMVATTHVAGPGWGGAFGFMAYYSKTLNQTEVSALYDSLANTSTHEVLPTMSGYAAEVEADNPLWYHRLNQASRPADWTDVSLLGMRRMLNHLTGNTYGHTGFTSGNTSVRVNSTSGGLLHTYGVSSINAKFSFECFLRATSWSTSPILLIQRGYNDSGHIYISVSTGGVPSINVTDMTGNASTVTFSDVALSTATDYHLVFTYDPWDTFLAQVYVNAVGSATVSATTLPKAVSPFQVLGSHNGWLGIACNPSGTAPTMNSNWLNGEIAEVALYNYVLPAARVQAHYDARNA